MCLFVAAPSDLTGAGNNKLIKSCKESTVANQSWGGQADRQLLGKGRGSVLSLLASQEATVLTHKFLALFLIRETAGQLVSSLRALNKGTTRP